MYLIQPLLIAQTVLLALLGLSIGYHMARAFRDIETHLGDPAFIKWFREAVRKATHHYDIGLAGMIAAISIFTHTNPVTWQNAGIFLFFMFLAAYWDDRADATPKELIVYAIQFIKKILSGNYNHGDPKY